MSLSYYSILGLEESASAEEVNEAYRNLVRVCHPDKHMKNKQLFENFMKSLNEAKEVLTGKSARKSRWSATDDRARYQMLLRENDDLKKTIDVLKEDVRKVGNERDQYKNELTRLQQTMPAVRALQYERDTLHVHLRKQKSSKKTLIWFFMIVVAGLSFLTYRSISAREKWTHVQHRLPFLVDSVTFFNSADTIHSSNDFKKSKIRYLSAQVHIHPIEPEKQKIKLQLRWINPDGTISRYPKDAKHTYSFSHDVVYDPAHPTISIPGWGNKTRSLFQPGEHSFEIWYQGHIIDKAFIKVMDK